MLRYFSRSENDSDTNIVEPRFALAQNDHIEGATAAELDVLLRKWSPLGDGRLPAELDARLQQLGYMRSRENE